MTWKPKLIPSQVAQIRKYWIEGQPQSRLAIMYAVHPSTISDIISGKTWKDIPWPGERKCMYCGGTGIETYGYSNISGA